MHCSENRRNLCALNRKEGRCKSCVRVTAAVMSMVADPKYIITGNAAHGPVKQINLAGCKLIIVSVLIFWFSCFNRTDNHFI